MKNTLLLISCFFVFGCTKVFDENNTKWKDGLFCDLKDKPLNGDICFRYPNSNKVSFKARVKEGVPNGEWFCYGYQKEIVQNGSHTPFEPEIVISKIRRIQKYEFNEGDYKQIYYLVIVKDSLIREEKDSVVEWIKKKFGTSKNMEIKFETKEFGLSN